MVGLIREEETVTSTGDWKRLVEAVGAWSQRMDQWEKFKFETSYGPIYVTISMQDQYPDSFDTVSLETGLVVKQAGIP